MTPAGVVTLIATAIVVAALAIYLTTVAMILKKVTFTLGTMLAAIGGALTSPTIAVAPGIGVEVIVLAFAVIVVGGLGSIPGALLGATVIGLSRACAVHLLPQAEVFAIYLIMTLVLIVRPYGLLGRERLRKV